MAVSNPPSYLQGGSHPARGLRRMTEAMTGDTEGALAAGELAVSEKSGTPNMSVDVSAGRAFILGTESAFQGTYFVESRNIENLTISAADATNPRKDIVVARVEDSEESGATDAWSLEVIAGTPAASPSAPAQPANSLLLATVDVAALASSITDANITTSTPVWAPAPVDTAGLVDGAVTEAKLAAGSVTSTKLATDSVSAAAIQAGAVGSSEIATGAVGSSEIGTGAVGSTALASGAVTNDKLAASGLDASKITEGTLPSSVLPEIDGSTLAANSVTAAEIAPDAVGQSELAANAVDSVHYVDGSIDRVHLAADVIDSTKLADNAVNSEHYVDGSIDRVHLAADVIDSTKLADNAVNSEHYVDGSVDNVHISSVAASKVTSGTFGSGSFTFPSALTVTGQINAGAGSVGAPSVYFGDSDTGFTGHLGAGTLNVVANGTTVTQWTSGSFKPLLAGVFLGANSTSQRWDTVYAANTTISTSDERLKVRTGEVPGSEFVLGLDTFVGRWTDKEEGGENTSHFFLSAQNVAESLASLGINTDESYLVHVSDEPEQYLSLAYTEIIPSLVKTIQELDARIVALEGE